MIYYKTRVQAVVTVAGYGFAFLGRNPQLSPALGFYTCSQLFHAVEALSKRRQS